MPTLTAKQDPVVILGASRTPMGSLLGGFQNTSATTLGTAAIAGALKQAQVSPESVQEVTMGCVLPAGLGQAPARQASLGAAIPKSAGCTTVNKICGSGMKSVMLANDSLLLDVVDVAVAGGMENMTRAPGLLPHNRGGKKAGHAQVFDHMMLDGLEDAYEPGTPMGEFGERTAQRFGFSRAAQEAFAIESVRRAKSALAEKRFESEVVPVDTGRGGFIETDEPPIKIREEKIPQLRPAFRNDGSITAATSSSIADGAAAFVLARESYAQSKGLTAMAKIVGHATHSRVPEEFTIAPVYAIRDLLAALNWSADSVDLWEINEAFAVVTMACMQELGLDHAKVNVNGGACALGHPIGASGARILVTLVHAMQAHGAKRGIASLCIGGGEATAVAIELVG